MTRLFNCRWLFRPTFPPLSVYFLTQQCTLYPHYPHHQKLIIASEFRWEFHFHASKLINCSLFDALQCSWKWVIHFEPHTLQITVFTRLYLLQTGAWRTMNKLAPSPLQGHTEWGAVMEALLTECPQCVCILFLSCVVYVFLRILMYASFLASPVVTFSTLLVFDTWKLILVFYEIFFYHLLKECILESSLDLVIQCLYCQIYLNILILMILSLVLSQDSIVNIVTRPWVGQLRKHSISNRIVRFFSP